MKILTKNGKRLLDDKMAKLELEIEDIRAEKAIAYTASGDTWHDNPGFNALEQSEHRKVEEIIKIKSIISSSKKVDISKRNTSIVDVGSIVKCIRINIKTDEELVEFWEIGGYGESNPKNKVVSYETPVGAALMGYKCGSETESVNIADNKYIFEIVGLYESWDSVNNER